MANPPQVKPIDDRVTESPSVHHGERIDMKTTDALAKQLSHSTAADDYRPYPRVQSICSITSLDSLPVAPPWLCYIGLWLALFLPYSAVKWWDRAYPIGTFNGLHLLLTGTSVYGLALIHYLDRSAGVRLPPFVQY